MLAAQPASTKADTSAFGVVAVVGLSSAAKRTRVGLSSASREADRLAPWRLGCEGGGIGYCGSSCSSCACELSYGAEVAHRVEGPF